MQYPCSCCCPYCCCSCSCSHPCPAAAIPAGTATIIVAAAAFPSLTIPAPASTHPTPALAHDLCVAHQPLFILTTTHSQSSPFFCWSLFAPAHLSTLGYLHSVVLVGLAPVCACHHLFVCISILLSLLGCTAYSSCPSPLVDAHLHSSAGPRLSLPICVHSVFWATKPVCIKYMLVDK